MVHCAHDCKTKSTGCFLIHYRQSCTQVSLCLMYRKTIFHFLTLFYLNDSLRQKNVSGRWVVFKFFKWVSIPPFCVFMPWTEMEKHILGLLKWNLFFLTEIFQFLISCLGKAGLHYINLNPTLFKSSHQMVSCLSLLFHNSAKSINVLYL